MLALRLQACRMGDIRNKHGYRDMADWMLDPPDDDHDDRFDDGRFDDERGDDIEPDYNDGYDDEASASASSDWQNSRNL